MKKIFIMLIFLVFLVALANNVSSFGPVIHSWIWEDVKAKGGLSNSVLSVCADNSTNEAALRSGNEIPDISVIYYYSQGGFNYRATHSWLFADEIMSQAITDDEKCFAVGISLHLIEDSVSHTYIVPQKIIKTKVPNWLLHPLLEQKYDSEFATEHPEAKIQSTKMLSAMYGAHGSRYIEMIETALGENNKMDVQKETDNLAYALNSFYSEGFAPKVQDNSLYSIYPYIQKVTEIVHPIVGKWNIGDMDANTDKTSQLVINTFNNWGSRYSLSPHGFTELSKADESTSFFVPGILIALLATCIIYPLYKIRKTGKFKYAYLFLLIIPVVLLAITIIYILL